MTPLPTNADKAQTAAWMGYPPGLAGIAHMDADHDNIHVSISSLLNLRSFSLAVADGKPLTDDQRRLAGYEEDAALMLQRYIQHARNLGEL